MRSLVRRYWWVLLLTVSCGLGFQSWRTFNQPDMYASSSDLIVRDEIQTDSTRRYTDSGSFIGNTLKMLQSPEVIEGAKRLGQAFAAIDKRTRGNAGQGAIPSLGLA